MNTLKFVCIVPWHAVTEDEKKRERIIADCCFHHGLLIDFDYSMLLDLGRNEVSPGERTVCFYLTLEFNITDGVNYRAPFPSWR